MQWSTPPERSRLSLLFLIFSILLIFSLSEARGATCEVIDQETQEIVAESSVEPGHSWEIPSREKMPYLPKNTSLSLQNHRHQISLVHSLSLKELKTKRDDQKVEFHLAKHGYGIECVTPQIKPLVRTENLEFPDFLANK